MKKQQLRYLLWNICLLIKNIFSIRFPFIAMKRNDEITNFLINLCKDNNFTKILDIGPGGPESMFPLATHIVDYRTFNFSHNLNILQYVIDIDQDKLPFSDKYFDFVYSRHVLEVFLLPLLSFFILSNFSLLTSQSIN